jgi:hypothetical protein
VTAPVTQHAELPSNAAVRDLLARTLTGYATPGAAGAGAPPPAPDPAAQAHLDRLLRKPGTHRDGILILFAYVVALGRPIDFRALDSGKIDGARGVAQWLATFLPTLHIAATEDAFQTVAKGRKDYVSETNPAWQALMLWASEQTSARPVEDAWRHLAAGIAATARHLPAEPGFDTPRMTYGRLAALFGALWDQPSGGAHEQFIWAALYAAYVKQLDDPGVVETKRLNASDASSQTAGDVQHKHRGVVLEAYEVTGRDWRTKMPAARRTLQRHGLQRIHVLAGGVTPQSGDEIAAASGDDDISVLDHRHASLALAHLLSKAWRREALTLLFHHLVRLQPDDQLVWDYVGRLDALGLTTTP